MVNDKTSLLTIGTFLVIGLVAGFFIGANKKPSIHIMPDGTYMSNDIMEMDMSSMMESMDKSLIGKNGDEFDKEFLKQMIVHHEGAVKMAEQALKNAKHPEIINLSNAIISSQSKEIGDMKSWLLDWYSIKS